MRIAKWVNLRLDRRTSKEYTGGDRSILLRTDLCWQESGVRRSLG
ncbi:MAG: hypothetical protein ACRC2R_24030 [Xenococcaceae cyanobacterium]